ncbi:DCC1-like thiol-disulfide oxidoreductase family protein [Mycolicibacterium neoaurum]|uniref:thiol-disulfide oxidoreductase DCC family protein n=1 Tax=Mycolicibacterium neoaurum TaxID=1795 RepID=UPI00248C7875|nr:DCC1-like thiol-disulfide oxidoreductase family protein [Mycolicibacterium neoaurum]MDO3401130.1 DCC1-like thiol-disulfide oxidoreductase family protein [Mycolicibacterium neoaurum]WBP94617.1 DCC1-like thiol-disulfide oxidoreductase family protein [Mycolicibacterium neoaurum]WBS08300.1 DCC1-like thiol-disulfide oxidoreductase family protein [Mycolicibacterium neoaurum]
MSTPTESNAPVLLYDGVCGVCNSAVRTLLRVDSRGSLRFAALDSDFARDVIARHPHLAGRDSVVFVGDPGGRAETVSTESAAMLAVADYLGGYWKLASVARVIPAFLRDRLYAAFAKVRYHVGGQYDTCPIPSSAVRSRFVDASYG